MSAKKTSTKKPASKKASTAKSKATKPRIKTVEDTAKGTVEVKQAGSAKGKKAKAAKPAKEKKVSALDAAAQVLAGSKEPMTTKEMIDAMAKKGLWTSPGGKTPHATLYSAILREINAKGKEARFTKTDRGHFTAKA